MHLPYRRGEPRIGQPAQQSRRRVLTLRCPQRFDEQHIDETGKHEIAARPLLAGLLADEPHQRGKPIDTAHVDQRRQERHQQCRIGKSKMK